MAKKKVYAVRQGKKTGIFYTWDACKAAVIGFSGAVYKSFPTEEEARAYLAGSITVQTGAAANAGGITDQTGAAANIGSITCQTGTVANIGSDMCQTGAAANTENGSEPDNPDMPMAGQIIAYVDGSFEVSLGRYAYGCVILTPEGEIIRKSGGGNEPEAAALRNVTGEMLGAMNAVKWSLEHGYTAVDIRYDYMGIEMWATGGWKAKNPLTQKYAEYMQKNAAKIKITFKKIAAHTGDKYNEEADQLAKAALEK